MRDQLLCAASGLDEESIAAVSVNGTAGICTHIPLCAHRRSRLIFLLCATGTASRCCSPRGDCVDGACGGVIVRAYDPAGERQELNDLEI